MKYTLLIALWFVSFVAAIPAVLQPGQQYAEEEAFSLSQLMDDILDSSVEDDEFLSLYDFVEDSLPFMGIDKRDTYETIESVLITLNKSDIIFDALDLIAGSDKRISLLANGTAKLIESLDGKLSLSDLTTAAAGLSGSVNFTKTYNAVKDSGLIQSLLDGILLDESYRHVLVNLTERIVYSNMDVLKYIIDDKLQKRDVEKRSDTTDSLENFVGNVVSTVFSYKGFQGILVDTLDALNDTGILTDVVKRIIADTEYQDMVAKYIKDLSATGAIDFNTSSITSELNITAIVDKALSNPTTILALVGKVLSGDFNYKQTFGKYASSIKAIVKDLENDGLFVTLNNELFSTASTSTSSTFKISLSTTADKKAVQTVSANGTTATVSADSGSTHLLPSNGRFVKVFFFLQSLVFGGALLMI